MRALVGDSVQRPPAYSAVKVGGRKLYEAARAGERLEAEPRPVTVHALELRDFDGRDARFLATVSAGTYVRVLVAEVGATLGCGAHLIQLVRTAIGSFRLEDAVALDRVGEPLPPAVAVAHLPHVDLDAEEARVARHGSILGPAGIEGPYAVFAPGGGLIGVYRDEGAKARPEVILAAG
jgi:tRNA pseudouridine55 synthase